MSISALMLLAAFSLLPLPGHEGEVARLASLCRVWGFLKYHHPGVARGVLDWDAALVEHVSQVREAKGEAALGEVLGELVDRADEAHGAPVGTEPPQSLTRPSWLPAAADEFERATLGNIDYRWLGAPGELPQALRSRLASIRDADAITGNHWIAPTSKAGNPTFPAELAYGEAPFPDTAHRLLALFRYWNVIQYFYPYKYAIGRDWNDVLVEFIPRVLACRNALDYHLTVLELSARIEDAHASGTSSPLLRDHFGTLRLPFSLSWIEGQAVIRDVPRSHPEGLENGDVLLSIDGRSVASLRKELWPLIAASNERGRHLRVLRRMLLGNSRHAHLEVRRGAESVELTVGRYTHDELRADREADALPAWETRNDGIGVLRPVYMRGNEMERALRELAGTRGLIIDLRSYPMLGWNQIAPPLCRNLEPFARLSKPDFSHPGLFQMKEPQRVGPLRDEAAAFRGPIVVLVNETTISAAEFTTMALQTVPGVQVVGSQTSGADGNLSSLFLPGGIRTTITGLGVFYPDGGETQHVGVRIDVEVDPTVEGVRGGVDEVLERGVRAILARRP